MKILVIVIAFVVALVALYKGEDWPLWVTFVILGLLVVVTIVQIVIAIREGKSEANITEKHTQLRKEIEERKPEKGMWNPSVHYFTDDSGNGYAQEISVDWRDYQYQRDQGIAKIDFDFSVDLKQVPKGSTLTIHGAPFILENGKLTEFRINQTGLNHSGEVMVSAKPNTTMFVVMVNTEGAQQAYVTDGSEGSVRFWGYIVYKCGYYLP